MHDGALLLGQIGEGESDGLAKGLVLRVPRRLEKMRSLAGEAGLILRARGAAPEKIARGVVGKPEQKRALVVNTVEQRRPARELEKELLQRVAGIGLIARDIEQEREEGIRVLVVKAREVIGH
jgi:hypothetical protein